MCVDCGCGDATGPRLTLLGAAEERRYRPENLARNKLPRPNEHPQAHEHPHPHEHPHEHRHEPPPASRTVTIEQAVLAKNDGLADRNRAWLRERHITAVNLMSSPGSGKTSLLERTVRKLAGARPVSVIEGDQETLLDAERIQATGCPVVQINTGAGCHLDAEMVAGGLQTLDPPPGSLLFVENVGNLVCPALFDLGESGKVVVISVTEGDDKPLKYPQMFAAADLVVVNKTDLLPYVDFDVEACAGRARSLNPGLEVISLSVKTGEGMAGWYSWLADGRDHPSQE